MNRTEFAQKHAIRIAKLPFVFIDTSGQKPHASRRLRAVREAMKRPLAGVVNVVSYGYHEERVGKDDAIAAGVVNETYLEQCRRDEITALDEWMVSLGDEKVAGWLMTVVTKADLWWNRHDAV